MFTFDMTRIIDFIILVKSSSKNLINLLAIYTKRPPLRAFNSYTWITIRILTFLPGLNISEFEMEFRISCDGARVSNHPAKSTKAFSPSL